MLKNILNQLQTAFGWLTRFPVYGKSSQSLASPPKLEDSLWAFPLAGGLVGAIIASFIYLLYSYINVPSFPAICLGLLLGVILTGGLHEDGLADCADGMAGGDNVDKRRTIMRDSRLGTYGVLALIFFMMTKIFLIESILSEANDHFFTIMILASASARGVIPLGLKCFMTKDQNSSAYMAKIPWVKVIIAFLIIILPNFYFYNPLLALELFAGMVLIICIIGFWAKRNLGGLSGDACGALAVVAEITYLLIIVSNISSSVIL